MSCVKLPDSPPGPQLPPRRFWDDEEWIGENIMDLVRKYPDQWIAVLNREVVAASSHLEEVDRVAHAREAEAGQGQCVYEFIEGGVRFYAGQALVSNTH